MQVYVRSAVLRFGAEHGWTARQCLREHVHLRSRGDPRLRRLHIPDELETYGTPLVRILRINGRRNVQFRLHTAHHFQWV